MQPSGVGGSELTRGLARFRSAPATWVEALLESEDEDDSLKPSLSPTQLPPTSSPAPSTRCPVPGYLSSGEPGLFDCVGAAASGLGFLRQNSSPAEFLTQIGSGSESYFQNFAIPSNYDDYLVSPSIDISPKRPRRVDSSQAKGELDGNLQGRMGGFPDGDMDKLFEDTVPCKIRAKRGFATHPRSIAERVRRTRISDRIRKLQELVPNMDKQTNTADMLDEAVEYVKFLQKQIQELTEHQKNCKCLNIK